MRHWLIDGRMDEWMDWLIDWLTDWATDPDFASNCRRASLRRSVDVFREETDNKPTATDRARGLHNSREKIKSDSVNKYSDGKITVKYAQEKLTYCSSASVRWDLETERRDSAHKIRQHRIQPVTISNTVLFTQLYFTISSRIQNNENKDNNLAGTRVYTRLTLNSQQSRRE